MSKPASITTTFCRFSVDRELEIPAECRDLLKTCLLDFIGIAAFAGRHAESSEAFRGFTRLGVGEGRNCVIGEGRRYGAPYAALLNGAFAHSLDFDDTHAGGVLHPGAPVIAAALALAENGEVSGRTFLDALAIGYEVCCRIGMSLTSAGYERGFHNTATAGIFGAVAALGRLTNCKLDILEQAFGLAGSRAAGSMQYLDNGAWNKRLHPGFAAHDALVVLALAEAGVIGAAEPIEGRYGLLHAFTTQARPEALLDCLGERWELLDTALKPYPSCRLTHGSVDAALELAQQFDPATLEAAHYKLRVSPTAVTIVGKPEPNKLAPNNVVDGQFSIYFQTAFALLYGKPCWSMYDRIGDARLVALAQQMTVESDPRSSTLGCELTIETAGEQRSCNVQHPLGERSHRLEWPDAVDKFEDLAGAVWSPGRVQAIVDAMSAIDDASDMRSLIELLGAE